MKLCFKVLLLFLLIPLNAFAGTTLAWFTDAAIESSTKLPAPTGAPALVSGGTYNNCLDLTQSVGLTNVSLVQTHGTISFWLKPKWDGKVSSSGSTHKLLKIGDPATNGLQIEANNSAGVLRYIMAGGGKVTIARADISTWKSGEWHHVQIAWIDKDSIPTGLAIWIDKVAVNSVVFGGTQYMNPTTMLDKKLYVGDATSNAYMDELIFRDSLTTYSWNSIEGGTPIAYKDYFRTAPYTAIQITNAPQKINAETRVVTGYKKQFGVIATKVVNADTGTTTQEYITNSDGPPGSQWDDWDAKPYINWTSSSSSKATVDYNGMVTGVAVTTNPITLTAYFRGMSATYSLNVISPDQPDLDLMYVERTPRYRTSPTATKVWPSVGETVSSIIHYGNFGYQSSTATTIKWELIPDSNNNFAVDPNEESDSRTISRTFNIAALNPGQTGAVTTTWAWPSYPVYVRVTIDPGNTISEICEVNNQRCDLNIAKSTHWGYGDNNNQFTDDWNGKTMNLVGSFSDYDWCQANVERWRVLMRETILPTTTPTGIQDTTRVDMFHTKAEYLDDHYNPNGSYWEGGFEEMWDTRMTLSPGNIHEMGHNTCGLSDLYGHGLETYNMLLKDENGNPYGGTPIYPVVSVYGSTGPWSSATWGYPDACGAGYAPLMVNNHLWLDRESAGIVQYNHQTRKGIPADFGVFIPNENSFQIYDANDNLLTNARIYIYQDVNTGCFMQGNKYYPDRPKFIITDGGTGNYVIPKTTCQYWDDPGTDYVEGATSCPQPFYHYVGDGTNTIGPSWQVGEMLLLKIVGANNQVEFQTLPLTEVNATYLSGNTNSATYTIRTSLNSPGAVPDVVPPTIQPGNYNFKPSARVKYNGTTYYSNFTITVPYNRSSPTTFMLDASVSSDSEGQQLYYRWDSISGLSLEAKPTITIPAGTDVGDYDIKLYVIDGLRYSDIRVITVQVRLLTPTNVKGYVLDKNNQPVAGAIVGIKKDSYATADANYYTTSDASGAFSYPILSNEQYNIAAWKEGWAPTKDSTILLGDPEVTVNLQLTDPSGSKINVNSQMVAASNCSPDSSIANAIDGNLNTGWQTTSYPTTPVYYYVDFGVPTDVTWATLHRYQSGYIRGDYQIDIMRSGNPLDPSAWQNNSSVETVYSANQTLHGYLIQSGVAVDPLRLDLTAVQGVRISLHNISGSPGYQYEMRDIAFGISYPPNKISDIKNLPSGSSCSIGYKEVTAIAGGGIPVTTCYIEEPDRSSGLRVNLAPVSQTKVNVGDLISLTGSTRSIAYGEKYVTALTIQVISRAPRIKPLGMNNLSASTGKKLSIGLLARLWGKVETVSTTYFTISTGTNATMKVVCGSLTKPAQGKLVAVNGIVSVDSSGTVLLMRSSSDWTEIPH